jgi:iron complex outermembrane receptor protein
LDSTYGTVAEPDVTIGLEQRRWDVRGAFNKPFSPSRRSTTSGASPITRTRSSKGRKSAPVFDVEGYDGRLEVLHEKVGLLEGGIGYQTQRTDFSALGEEAFLPPVETQTHALFALRRSRSIRCACSSAALRSPGKRSRETEIFGPSLARDFDAFSGSAGIFTRCLSHT